MGLAKYAEDYFEIFSERMAMRDDYLVRTSYETVCKVSYEESNNVQTQKIIEIQ